MSKTSKILIACLSLGLLVGGGILAFSLSRNNDVSLCQSSLYIGIPKKQDNYPVKLLITVQSSSGNSTKEFSSEDLQTLDGQDENLVFLNYSADPLVPLGNEDIGYWLSQNGNSIKVQTCSLELYYSEYVNITKAGVWFINAPAADGAVPDFSYSEIYQKGSLL